MDGRTDGQTDGHRGWDGFCGFLMREDLGRALTVDTQKSGRWVSRDGGMEGWR
jgi:hypothetical protein